MSSCSQAKDAVQTALRDRGMETTGTCQEGGRGGRGRRLTIVHALDPTPLRMDVQAIGKRVLIPRFEIRIVVCAEEVWLDFLRVAFHVAFENDRLVQC